MPCSRAGTSTLVLLSFLTGKEHTYAGSVSVPTPHTLPYGVPVYARPFSRQPSTPHPSVIPSGPEGYPEQTSLENFIWRAGACCWRDVTIGGRAHYAGEHAYPQQLVDRRDYHEPGQGLAGWQPWAGSAGL